jgi:carboxyl-terminal processing protease
MKFRLRVLSVSLALLSLPALAADPPAAKPAASPAAAAPAPVVAPVATPVVAPAAAAKSAEAAKPADDARLPLNDLRTFVDVFERIRNSYVEPVDDKTLFENAIRGMLSSLDPHSAYLDTKDFADLQNATTGEFGGVGLEVGLEDGALKVISPIDDTPAAKAGLQSGDYIIKIDGQAVKGLGLNDAIGLMRGKPGSKIKLTVVRPGQDPKDVTLVRAKIETSSVRSRTLEDGYVMVRISQFQNHTGRDLNRELDKLKAANKTGIRGLVLDLRNNPGGVLNGAVEVADTFLDDGLVVYTLGRVSDSNQKYYASPGQALPGVPVVVLVNGGTASASEIVSGALQDHKRAVIVGTLTFGKGSVQSVLPLSADKGIKLTTARYYTPSGRSIQAEGIKPDIVVEPAKLTKLGADELFHEADLSGHLANPQDKSSGTDDSGDKPKDDKPEKLEQLDYQLYAALNILKGMSYMTLANAAPTATAASAKPAATATSGDSVKH